MGPNLRLNNRMQAARAMLLVVVASILVSANATAQSSTKGRDFWLSFSINQGNLVTTPALSLRITGKPGTSGSIAVPGAPATIPFTVGEGSLATVSIPTVVITNNDLVETKGVHVVANDDVSVYGFNVVDTGTSGAFLALPTQSLGAEYIVLTYKNGGINNENDNGFAIVAAHDATTVTITPSVATGFHPAGVAYTKLLNKGQTYQLLNNSATLADLSGTVISADKAIAVFGVHRCAQIPLEFGACDHVVEQLPPTPAWGQSFVTVPFATRLNGDTLRVIASADNTTVSLNSSVVATLQRGQLWEAIVATPAHITADKKVLVAQFAHGRRFDNVDNSDPLMMLITPVEQFSGSYIAAAATGFTNYLNLVVPSSAVGSVQLNGVTVPLESFSAIGTSPFSGAQLSVAPGAHRLTGAVSFGAFVYGFVFAQGYGYAAGMGGVDSDGDGIADAVDNCPGTPNPDQANGDDDGFGDACDNCPLVSNPGQEDTPQPDGLGDACTAHYAEALVVEGGTKNAGDSILVTATFTNTSGGEIFTIRPDCVNTTFTASFQGGEIPLLLDPNIREKIYGIPNDLVTIPAGASVSVTCNLAEMFAPGILNPDSEVRTVTVEATYSNFIVDPDIVNGVCTSPDGCFFDIWVGSVASAPVQIAIQGPGDPDATAAPESIPVTVDIKPGAFPNSINLGSNGGVPVAILSTSTFDATRIDPTTVTLADAAVKVKGKGTPMASAQDVNSDGLMDLVVHVSTEGLALTGTDTQAYFEGRTFPQFGGTLVIGVDSIRVVP